MNDARRPSSCETREPRLGRGLRVEAPNEHQGICDALSRSFELESVPDDFKRLLMRMR